MWMLWRKGSAYDARPRFGLMSSRGLDGGPHDRRIKSQACLRLIMLVVFLFVALADVMVLRSLATRSIRASGLGSAGSGQWVQIDGDGGDVMLEKRLEDVGGKDSGEQLKTERMTEEELKEQKKERAVLEGEERRRKEEDQGELEEELEKKNEVEVMVQQEENKKGEQSQEHQEPQHEELPKKQEEEEDTVQQSEKQEQQQQQQIEREHEKQEHGEPQKLEQQKHQQQQQNLGKENQQQQLEKEKQQLQQLEKDKQQQQQQLEKEKQHQREQLEKEKHQKQQLLAEERQKLLEKQKQEEEQKRLDLRQRELENQQKQEQEQLQKEQQEKQQQEQQKALPQQQQNQPEQHEIYLTYDFRSSQAGNQYHALLNGILLASSMNWTLVVPPLIANGMESFQQMRKLNLTTKALPMGYFFDINALKRRNDIRVLGLHEFVLKVVPTLREDHKDVLSFCQRWDRPDEPCDAEFMKTSTTESTFREFFNINRTNLDVSSLSSVKKCAIGDSGAVLDGVRRKREAAHGVKQRVISMTSIYHTAGLYCGRCRKHHSELLYAIKPRAEWLNLGRNFAEYVEKKHKPGTRMFAVHLRVTDQEYGLMLQDRTAQFAESFTRSVLSVVDGSEFLKAGKSTPVALYVARSNRFPEESPAFELVRAKLAKSHIHVYTDEDLLAWIKKEVRPTANRAVHEVLDSGFRSLLLDITILATARVSLLKANSSWKPPLLVWRSIVYGMHSVSTAMYAGTGTEFQITILRPTLSVLVEKPQCIRPAI